LVPLLPFLKPLLKKNDLDAVVLRCGPNRLDALIYARALSDRSPGTHSLHLMENADHNFTKRQDEVVNVIMDWWEARRRGALKTGIWLTEINPGNAKL
jgi:hypothetical protein